MHRNRLHTAAPGRRVNAARSSRAALGDAESSGKASKNPRFTSAAPLSPIPALTATTR